MDSKKQIWVEKNSNGSLALARLESVAVVDEISCASQYFHV